MTITSSNRSIVIETFVATVITLALVALANHPFLGLGLVHPHPIWIVVLVVAARYGARGLLIAVPVAWLTLTALAVPWASASVGAGSVAGAATRAAARADLSWRAAPERLFGTLATAAELGALGAAVLVGWVASGHERRVRASAEKIVILERRAGVDASAIEELRRAALALRARNDRLDLSLTFLRGAARRLEGADPVAAADAALELATTRLGARAAAVLLVDSPGHGGAERLVAFAVSGVFSPDGQGQAGEGDGTVTAAFEGRKPTRAMDLASGGPGDSDLAAPIVEPGSNGSHAPRGVLAVRGVPRGGVGVAALRDLAIIAEWSWGALARAKTDRGAPARLLMPVPGGAAAPAAAPTQAQAETETDETSADTTGVHG
jgi:hypothetical protein